MAPKRPPNAAKMAILARCWKLLGPISDDFGGFLAVRLNIKKHEKPYVFKRFLKVWGPEWKPNRRRSSQDGYVESKLGCLGRSWLQVGLSWAILVASWAVLGDVGSKMERNGATRSAKRSRQRLPDGKHALPGGGNGPQFRP